MSLNWKQFELGVLRPTLNRLDVYADIPSPEVAVRLVGETLWHESDRLTALGQYAHGDEVFGPGLGVSSFEEPTWNWLYPIYHAIAAKLGHNRKIEYDELAWNLALNVIACRLRYYVDKRRLPVLDSGIDGRADYWFQVYNASGVTERREKFKIDAAAIHWIGEPG